MKLHRNLYNDGQQHVTYFQRALLVWSRFWHWSLQNGQAKEGKTVAKNTALPSGTNRNK